tara:strand:+ start:7771 stop:8850 length:1080 start_codon:yes stop_codon:yes gene_type:complete
MNGIRNTIKMLRIGIIGCGRIFKKHFESIKKRNLYELVAITDIDKSKLNDTLINNNLNRYIDYNIMVINENLDIVSILTDSGSHEEIINNLAGKVRNIIVEKPFTLKSSGAAKVVEKCKNKLTRIFVVHQNRLNDTVKKLFEYKNQNLFGKIFLCSVNLYWSRTDEYYISNSWRGKWLSDGGAISNQGIHYIDIIHKLLGDPYTISAEGQTALSNIETEDTALINFKYKNGCLVNFQITTAIRPKNIEGSISVFSENGSFQIGGEALNQIKNNTIKNNNEKSSINYKVDDVYGGGHILFYEKIYKSIIEDNKSQFEGENFIKQIRLLNAIYLSIENSEKIYFDPNKNYKSRLGVYESKI